MSRLIYDFNVLFQLITSAALVLFAAFAFGKPEPGPNASAEKLRSDYFGGYRRVDSFGRGRDISEYYRRKDSAEEVSKPETTVELLRAITRAQTDVT